MTIDLCVINYNTKDKLERFLVNLNSDLDDSINPPWVLHVADNGSTDGSGSWLAENSERFNVDTLNYNTNIGYAAAANDLAYGGSSDIIGILNADVWMTTAHVHSIQQAFNTSDAAIIGPKQRDEEGLITHAGIFGSLEAPKHRGWRESDPYDTKYRSFEPCVTVSGAAYFIRRDVWNELAQNEEYLVMIDTFRERGLLTDRGEEVRGRYVGAFLPTRHYYEETWCSYFATHLGHKVYYDGRVSIGHSWHASSEVGGEADRLFAESKTIFVNACEYFGIPHD